MIWLALLLVQAQVQEPLAAQGARLYRTYCAVAYCHGPEGMAGRAPKLAGSSLSPSGLLRTISSGIPDKGMPPFSDQMKTEEMEAIVQYLMTLGAGSASGDPAKPAAPALPPEARQGKNLFFDAARTGACGACHEIDGWGIPVGPDLAALKPEGLADLRAVPQSRVVTARPQESGPPFPALPAEQTPSRIRLYDLTGPLPVLRTFASGRVTLTPGSAWQHGDATRLYTGTELQAIAAYLRWRSRTPQPR